MYGVEEPEDFTDERFIQAIHAVEATKIHWIAQLEMCLRHPVTLWLDVQALHGNFDLVQPFVHQAISGTLTAISMLAFDPQWQHKIAITKRVLITLPAPGQQTFAKLENGTLTMFYRLGRDAEFANQVARSAIVEALGGKAEFIAEREESELVTEPVDENPELAAFAEFEEAQKKPAAPAKAAAKGGDLYQRAKACIARLEQVMRQEGLWPGDKPHGEIEVRGAFGSENMAFTQWIAWILIDRVRDIIQTRGTFPSQSQVSTYARREFDGLPGGDAVTNVLMELDDLVNSA